MRVTLARQAGRQKNPVPLHQVGAQGGREVLHEVGRAQQCVGQTDVDEQLLGFMVRDEAVVFGPLH